VCPGDIYEYPGNGKTQSTERGGAVKFKIIHEDEISDARRCARSCGFLLEEFSVEEIDLSPKSGGVHPISGKLRVLRKGFGSAREYDIGHSSSWPADFCRDLEAGVFGLPAKAQ
jgi:hypothetical protein